MLKAIIFVITIVILIIMTPNTVMADNRVFPEVKSDISSLMDADLSTKPESLVNYSHPSSTNNALNMLSRMFESDSSTSSSYSVDPYSAESIANQKIADEKEAAQMKQWNNDAQMKANGTMPICKEGESPLSEWMALPNPINDYGTVDVPIIFETCVEPEKKMGAILLFPIE